MYEKHTLKAFITMSNYIHNYKYDYSQSIYENYHTKLNIICLKHGSFTKTPCAHINKKQGCPKCSKETKKQYNKFDKNQFVKIANNIYNNKYDYSKVIYINCNTNITINCPIHGDFKKTPSKHIYSKQGCPICSKIVKIVPNRLSASQFINKANIIHNNKYEYNNVKYINSNTKVCITCKKHGDFWQLPTNHYTNGCPKCKNSIGERLINTYLLNHSIIFETQKKFEKCKNKRCLPFDFYLPEYNILIEFDGEQHFRPYRTNSINSKLKFNQTKINDEIKNNYCILSNIQLIRISYMDKKKINEILDKLFIVSDTDSA